MTNKCCKTEDAENDFLKFCSPLCTLKYFIISKKKKKKQATFYLRNIVAEHYFSHVKHIHGAHVRSFRFFPQTECMGIVQKHMQNRKALLEAIQSSFFLLLLFPLH